jgi:hypothetical protein
MSENPLNSSIKNILQLRDRYYNGLDTFWFSGTELDFHFNQLVGIRSAGFILFCFSYFLACQPFLLYLTHTYTHPILPSSRLPTMCMNWKVLSQWCHQTSTRVPLSIFTANSHIHFRGKGWESLDGRACGFAIFYPEKFQLLCTKSPE